MSFFDRGSRTQVGIDIGTSSIKAVELKQEGSRLTLENYGVIYGLDYLEHVAKDPTDQATFKMSEDEIAAVITKLLSFSNIKAEEAIFPIPIFSSFLTMIELPAMSMEDLEKAVSLQAQSYIPAPLEEVVLDWIALPPKKKKHTGAPEQQMQHVQGGKGDVANSSIPGKSEGLGSQSAETAQQKSVAVTAANHQNVPEQKTEAAEKMSVLLVAIPREVIDYYERIATLAGLKVQAVESESFSTVRSLVGNDPQTTMLIDLGARSSTLTIVDQGFVRVSHTVDFSGKELTDSIAKGLNISTDRAEELKKKEGFAGGPNADNIKQVLSPVLSKLVGEYKKMADYYASQTEQEVEKVILSGGSAYMPGLTEYLTSQLGITVTHGNPFARIQYPKELESVVTRDLAPHLAVATGAAMRDME